jgi:hypothetical protein
VTNGVHGSPAASPASFGILVGSGLRDLNVTDNLIRNPHIGIGVSVDIAAAVYIAGNTISETKYGNIRTMNGPSPIGPDLASKSA